MPNLDRSLPFLPEMPQFSSVPPKLPEPAPGGPTERAARPAFLEFLQRRRRDQGTAATQPPPSARPANSAPQTPQAAPRATNPPTRTQNAPPETRADDTREAQSLEAAAPPQANETPNPPAPDTASTAKPIPAPSPAGTTTAESSPVTGAAETLPHEPAPHFQQGATGLVVPESFPQAFASFDTAQPHTVAAESTNPPVIRRVDTGRPQAPDGLLKTLYPEQVAAVSASLPETSGAPSSLPQALVPETPSTVPAEIFTTQTAPRASGNVLVAPPLTAAIGETLNPAAVSVTPSEPAEAATQPVLLDLDGAVVQPRLPEEPRPATPASNESPNRLPNRQAVEVPLQPIQAAAQTIETPAPNSPPAADKAAPTVPTSTAVEQHVVPPRELRSPEAPTDEQPPSTSPQPADQTQAAAGSEPTAVSPDTNAALENCFAPPEPRTNYYDERDGDTAAEQPPRSVPHSVPIRPAAGAPATPHSLPNPSAAAGEDALPRVPELLPTSESIKPVAPRSETPAPVAGAAKELSHADARQLVDRVAKAVNQAAEQRNNKLQIRLHPPELGILTIEVTSREGAIVARLEVQTAAAQQTLMEHLPQLKDALAHGGNHVDRIDVQVVDPGNDKGRPDSEERGQRQQNSSGQSEHESDRQQHERNQQRDQHRRPDQPAAETPGNDETPPAQTEPPGSLMEGLNIQV